MTVGIAERKLRRQCGRECRIALLTRKTSRKAAAVPPLADHYGQLIFLTGTDPQLVLLHLQALLIDGPAGRKDKIAHAAAVKRGLIDAHRRDPKRSRGHDLRAEKRLSERRADAAVRLRGTDPVCVPLHIACLLFKSQKTSSERQTSFWNSPPFALRSKPSDNLWYSSLPHSDVQIVLGDYENISKQ